MFAMNLILGLVGVWFVTTAMIVNATGGITSKLFFKVVPFFSGLFCLFYALKLSNLV